MKTIKLLNLSAGNFKGLRELALDFSDDNTKIYGHNGTGKTSVQDAFLWNLFGKDSNNRADFAIKTLDEDGKEIPNLEHVVEASYDIDGQPLTLKKVFKEKYTKRRGQVTAEFTGHETNHYIDGVPVKKKEYEEKVSSIVDENIFKLITSPTYFNESLKWQDRRKVLLEILGDIDMQDVIEYNNALKELPTILQNRTVEDHKKVVAEKRKEINKELEMIPVRIDELTNSMPDEIDVSSIESEVATIEKQLDDFATQINNVKNGSAVNEKQNLLRQIELDLKEIQNELESEATEKGYQVQAKIQEEQGNLSVLQRKKDDAKHEVERTHREVIDIDNKLVKLRKDWANVNERQFEQTHQESTCPTCNQDLPAEQVKVAHEKALYEFNLSKSNDLEIINANGKDLSVKKAELEGGMQTLIEDAESFKSQIESKEKAIKKLKVELESLRNQIKDARQDERYVSKVKEQESTKEEIKALQGNAQEAITGLENEVSALRTKRAKLNEEIAKQAQIKANEKRIAELEERQKELATEFEQLEKELFLTEQFTKSKVELLEERINSKFKYARFKLFDTQINGGLQEVCETTVNGVPYGSGLNDAAKINVGLDICQTLQEHYGIKAPVWIDNSESVVDLLDIDTQMISLIVSGEDKELRVETQVDEAEGVA